MIRVFAQLEIYCSVNRSRYILLHKIRFGDVVFVDLITCFNLITVEIRQAQLHTLKGRFVPTGSPKQLATTCKSVRIISSMLW
jgi:hypothetical protein